MNYASHNGGDGSDTVKVSIRSVPTEKILLTFTGTSYNKKLRLCCFKDETLSDVVVRLINNGFIYHSSGDVYRVFKGEEELRSNCPIGALGLDYGDSLRLVQIKHKPKPMVCLYGCPSAKELAGEVPDCMETVFEDLNFSYR